MLWGLHDRLRERRADLFTALVGPVDNPRILDLGGADGNLARKISARMNCSVTVADVNDHSVAAKRSGFEFVHLEPNAERLPFADREFDLVLCNSVIEHVTLPKHECLRTDYEEGVWRSRAWDAQSRFAGEIRRVARGYFVQTPHRDFPIELHTWLPGVNWLSHNQTQRLVRFTDRYWIKRCDYADWHLLRPKELQQLFPEARIHVERLAGFPKSLIAYKRP